MPTGIIINVASVVLGGLLGSLIGNHLSDRLKREMTTVFGVCAMAMGISSIVLMKNMPAVIFAIIIGTLIGTLINLDGLIKKGTGKLLNGLHMGGSIDEQLMVTAMVLFCASGTGIYGSMTSGMTGDHSILIAKSVLDFFTAMIFACQLKKATMLIGIPQAVIMLLLFFGAKLILPLTTDVMIADFKACGGIVLLATGFTIMKVKEIPVANMILSMVLVMPVSALWVNVIAPLL
ncbi:MAG: DUF554 domain-containing protein [Lachnospiraceae bacterium]|nr:DUF554 domain-containing protein [Lachnospiraceae bacterium]